MILSMVLQLHNILCNRVGSIGNFTIQNFETQYSLLVNTREENLNWLSDISSFQMKKYPPLIDNQLYLKYEVKSLHFAALFPASLFKETIPPWF